MKNWKLLFRRWRRIKFYKQHEAEMFHKICQFIKIPSSLGRNTERFQIIWVKCFNHELLSIGLNWGKNQSIINAKSVRRTKINL